MEIASRAMASGFQVKEVEVENANVWGKKIREKARALENSCVRGSCGAVEVTDGEPTNHREMMKRPEEERSKWQEAMDKEFKDFARRSVSCEENKRHSRRKENDSL